MILCVLTFIFFILRCSHPCAHVLKVTNELTLEMIKVQHWKLYATHYNDDGDSLGIDVDLKKLQFQYSNYEGMGVPISGEVLTRSQRPSNDDLFSYFYDGTTMDEYKSALAVESTGCCVTKIEYAKSNGIEKKL
jgi:hypothetical protein